MLTRIASTWTRAARAGLVECSRSARSTPHAVSLALLCAHGLVAAGAAAQANAPSEVATQTAQNNTAASAGASETAPPPIEVAVETAPPPIEVAVEAAPPPMEVVVETTPPPETQHRLTAHEVRSIPGAFNDPFRAIEALPGVTPMVTGLPYFFVRGAPPGNVGYLLEGIRVPQLFHMGLGPSILAGGLIESAELYPGAYPASLGRYSGAIVEGTLAAPRTEPRAQVRLLLTDVGALTEVPWGDRTTALVAGRYSIIEPLVQLVAPDTTLAYWDYQLRLNRSLGGGQSVRLFVFGSHDRFGSKTSTLGTEFHRVDLAWTRETLSGQQDRVALTLGQDETFDTGSIGRVRLRTANLRVKHLEPISDSLQVNTGFDARFDAYRALAPWVPTKQTSKVSDAQNFLSALATRNELVAGAYTEAQWSVGRVSLRPGIRADVYSTGDVQLAAFEPRAGVRYQLSPDRYIEHAVGIVHQPPSFVVPVPGLQLSTLDDGLQQSVQSSVTYFTRLPAALSLKTTAFHNLYFNTTDALGLSSVPADLDHEARTNGRSLGLEALLKRSFSQRLGGLMSATLGRSTRTLGRYSAPSAWDRTFVMNAAASYRFDNGWRAGARLVFYTGRPPDLIAPPKVSGPGGPSVGDIAKDPAIADALEQFQDSTNRAPSGKRRTAPFLRLDLRAEKRWTWSNGAFISAIVEILNASAQPEEFDMDCTPKGCFVDSVGPVIFPNIGIEAGI